MKISHAPSIGWQAKCGRQEPLVAHQGNSSNRLLVPTLTRVSQRKHWGKLLPVEVNISIVYSQRHALFLSVDFSNQHDCSISAHHSTLTHNYNHERPGAIAAIG